jgi:hypothetical protein
MFWIKAKKNRPKADIALGRLTYLYENFLLEIRTINVSMFRSTYFVQ